MSGKSSRPIGSSAQTTQNPPPDVSLSEDFDVKEVPEDDDISDGDDQAARSDMVRVIC